MKYSQKQFADYLRGNYPTEVRLGESDKVAVDRWLVEHPEDRSLLDTNPEPEGLHAGGRGDAGGIFTTAAITGARIVPSVIGGVVGGVLGGGAASIPGMVAGGAAGGAIGETIAQFLERSTGRREDYNPTAMAVEAGIGAIPVTKLLKGGRALQIAGEAAKGGVMGGGSTAALQWAEDQPFNPAQIATGGLLGTAIGGASGHFATKAMQRGHVSSEFADAKHQDIINKRANYDDGVINSIESPLPDVLDDAGNVVKQGVAVESTQGDKLRARMYDYLAEGRSFLERLARYGGFDPEELHAAKIADTQRGGVGHLALDAEDQVEGLLGRIDIATGQNITNGNMRADVTYFLDLKGFVHAGETFKRQAQGLESEIKILRQEAKKGSPGTRAKKRDLIKKKVKERNELYQKGESGEALPEGYTPATARAELLNFRDKMNAKWGDKEAGDYWAEMESYADELFHFNRETLDVMKQSGFVDNDLYKLLTETDDHIPLNRYLESMSDSWAQGSTPLHKLEGSTKTTLDPFAASLLRRRTALLAGAHNNSKVAFVNTRGAHEDFKKMIPELKATEEAQEGFSKINVWIEGEERFFALPTGVAAAVENLDQAATNVLGDIGVNFFTRLTQRMATSLNLGFSFTNVLRDVADVALLREVVDNPREFGAFAMDWASAAAQLGIRELQDALRPVIRSRPVANILGKDKAQSLMNLREVKFGSTGATRGQFVQEGAGFAGLQRQLDARKGIRGTQQADRGFTQSVGDTFLGGVDLVLGPVGRISNVLEEATKLASYNTLTRKGVTGLERAIKTRRFGGSPDFALRGKWAAQAGNFILFYNAQMQGIVRNARGIKNLVNGKDLKTAKGRQAVATIMLPLTGLEVSRQIYNAQFTDPDGTPSIDRITDSDHNNYFTWILPDLETVDGVTRHKAIKFSKGHMARVLYNPLQDVIRAAFTPSGKPFKPTQTVLDLTEQFLPGSMKLESVDTGEKFMEGMLSSLAPLFKTPIELGMNLDAFSGTPITSRYNLGIDPSQRTTSRTSPSLSRGAKQLAEDTGFEISPITTQKIVRNIIPGGGEQAIEAADIFAGGGNVAQAIGGGLIQPIARRFVRSKGDQKQRDQMNRFYRVLKQAEMADKTLRDLRVNNPGGVQTYINKHARLLQQRPTLLKVRDRLSEIRRSVPDEVKGPYLNQLLEQVMGILDAK